MSIKRMSKCGTCQRIRIVVTLLEQSLGIGVAFQGSWHDTVVETFHDVGTGNPHDSNHVGTALTLHDIKLVSKNPLHGTTGLTP